jgi:hypothetical protein
MVSIRPTSVERSLAARTAGVEELVLQPLPASRDRFLPRVELARHGPLRLGAIGKIELAAKLVRLVDQLCQRVGVLHAGQFHHHADALVAGQLPDGIDYLEQRAGIGGHAGLDLGRGEPYLVDSGAESSSCLSRPPRISG